MKLCVKKKKLINKKKTGEIKKKSKTNLVKKLPKKKN